MPNKRERIVIAASNLLKNGNYQNMSTAKIAKIANVAEGTLYRYFKNKDDIFIEAVSHTLENIHSIIFEGVSSDSLLIENLELIIKNIYSIIDETESLYKVYYKAFSEIESPQVKKLLSDWLSKNFKSLKNIFLWAKEKNEIKIGDEDIDFVVRWLWGTTELILREGALGITQQTYEDMKKYILKVTDIIEVMNQITTPTN